MSDLVRFGISLDKHLSDKFDKQIKKKGYANRSEAIRDLIRNNFVQQQWEDQDEVAGAVTIIFDHHKRELQSKITDIQHDFHGIIMASQHIHLDHNNCLEIIAVKGRAKEVKRLSDLLSAIKGVKHGTLNMSTTGEGIL